VNPDRYHRQQLLPQIGAVGQQRLAQSRVLLIGCGALGSVIADQLARAGIGFLRILDRDLVEWTNLQRQVLYDESDARDAVPKAIAAAKRLAAINSSINVDARAIDVDGGNIESLIRVDKVKVDLILDGTDNVETRYLINDLAVKHNLPWIYGACVGTEGRAMSIVPGKTACLRCLFAQPPNPGELPTCDTAGVLAPVANIIASLQVTLALKLLLAEENNRDGTYYFSAGQLIRVDGWSPRFHVTETRDARRDDCPTCVKRQFEFLDRSSSVSARLCGRNAVQVRPEAQVSWSLDELAQKLESVMIIQRTPYLLRCRESEQSPIELSVFPDGRAIVHGTSDPARARAIYARYIGA
jgi:molybdopterin-synthase adenylyltransferase